MNMFLPREIGPIYTQYELEDWFAPLTVTLSIGAEDFPKEVADLFDKWIDKALAMWAAFQYEEAVMLSIELGRGEG